MYEKQIADKFSFINNRLMRLKREEKENKSFLFLIRKKLSMEVKEKFTIESFRSMSTGDRMASFFFLSA